MIWRHISAATAGTSHLKEGRGCDDSVQCLVVKNDTFIAAVSDGAGSASLSSEGSAIAVNVATSTLEELARSETVDFEKMVAEAAEASRQAIFQAADDLGSEAREFSCTLLLVIVGPSGGAALQIGDGAIVVSEDGLDWAWVFWPQHGEYANTTRFVTDDDAPEQWVVGPLRASVVDVAIFSDGLERLALDLQSQSAHSPFFRPLFQAVSAIEEGMDLAPALLAFLNSPAVTERSDDDLSLILATTRRQSAAV